MNLLRRAAATFGCIVMATMFLVASPTEVKQADACTNCTYVSTRVKKVYTRIVLNGTAMPLSTYKAYLLAAANGGMPAPTWSGCFDEKIVYSVVQHYIIGSKTMYHTNIGAHWCWGPGDHINGYPTPPPHIAYISNTCCYIGQARPPDVLAFWYHLPGRAIDSGYRVNVHFSIQQCAPYVPLPCGTNDVLMWLEMHGNGTDAYDAGGGKVIG